MFFDIETTGLSGGAGTLAFLAGCGWFEDERFRVRQFFLGCARPASARCSTRSAQIFDERRLLVTYNGRTFDVPLMETRWAFHRTAAPTDDLPHFDMLPPARRLCGAAGSAPDAGRRGARRPSVSCSLSALERAVLGFHRLGDVPGFEIPARYFHFLRTGDAAVVDGRARAQPPRSAVAGRRDGARAVAGAGGSRRVPRERASSWRSAGSTSAPATATRAIGVVRAGARAADERDVRRARAGAPGGAARRARTAHDEAAAAWQGVLEPGATARDGCLAARAARGGGARDSPRASRARLSPAARRYAEQLAMQASGRAPAAVPRIGSGGSIARNCRGATDS